MNQNYDFVVIGGGSAGLVAASGAALLGARVALIEKHRLGGDCLYTGCVPSKALIRSARFAADVRRAETFGFQVSDLQFQNNNFASITNRIKRVIKTIEHHDSPERFEKMGVEIIFGTPRFLSARELEVSVQNNGNKSDEKRILKAKRFCLATGSKPAVPAIDGLREAGFVTNETIFDLQSLPRKLVVIGGGAIGVELGQSFARFGSEVTIIEMSDRILDTEDREISSLLENILRRENVEVLTNTKVVGVKTQNETKSVVFERNGNKEEIAADEILVATGREPNIDGLELEKATVKFDKKRVETDEYLRTSARNIFAAGDVTGHYQFTHMADLEAQIVIQNAFLFYGLRRKTDFRIAPWAFFTSPEVGRVGLTEKEARTKFGDKIKIYRVNFDENDRAQTDDDTTGFAKIVCRKNGEIVGAHLVGPSAGELIHEFVWAMHERLKISELNKIIRVYPTLAKIIQAAGTEATIEKLTSPLIQKWFARYLKIWR